MQRIAIVCPGRGSYTEKSLRSLPASHPWLEAAERLRAEAGLPSLRELDGAARFSAAEHLRPANVSALIYAHSMLDAAAAAEGREVVAVAGNSMGWYTALAVAGALSFEDGFKLVQGMALIQERHEQGGQILYPLVDEEWRPDATRRAAVEAALAALAGQAFPSIHLAGYAVLAGTEAGVAGLLQRLPQVKLGGTLYPFRLLRHGPYHTPLLAEAAAEARRAFQDLGWRRPRTTLIDGRGRRFGPLASSAAALFDYTVGAQVTTPYDLSASLRVLLREHAPAQVFLPGPGNTLGGVLGQALIAEGWRGIRTKSDFQRAQESAAPPAVSMRR